MTRIMERNRNRNRHEVAMNSEPIIAPQPSLTLAGARRVLAAAEAEALANRWPVVIAVVDTGGRLLTLARLDQAQYGSVEIALKKAEAAVAFKRPTKSWSDALVGGRQAVLSLPGVLPSEGGVPVEHDGCIIGAIGVSGVQPEQDGQIARAGAAALAQ
jgi:glc operon protein GlcG